MLLPLMVRSKGLSAQTVGLLWTVLPVVGLITNSISGMLADYLKAHRIVFLGSLISMTTGIVSIYWIPKLPFVSEASEKAFSLAALGNVTLRSSTLIVNSSSLGMDMTSVDPDMTVGEGQAAPFALPPDEETMVVPEETMGLASLVDYPQFWLIFFVLMVEQMGISTCIMISDAVCFQILGKEVPLTHNTTTTNNSSNISNNNILHAYNKPAPPVTCCHTLKSLSLHGRF